MALRHVYLYLNNDEFDRELVTAFGFRTRYVCNYLQRHLRSPRQGTPYSAVLVQGTKSPPDMVSPPVEGKLIAGVPFAEAAYLATNSGDRHELFLSMLEDGFARCAQSHPFPAADARRFVDMFRLGGYRNVWQYESKRLRLVRRGRAILECDLDQERFRLELAVYIGTEVIRRELVLETLPDEIIFAHRFKSMRDDGAAVAVLHSSGTIVHSMDISDLVA